MRAVQAVVDLFIQCTAQDPAQRPSAKAVLERLLQLAPESRLPTPAATSPTPPATQPAEDAFAPSLPAQQLPPPPPPPPGGAPEAEGLPAGAAPASAPAGVEMQPQGSGTATWAASSGLPLPLAGSGPGGERGSGSPAGMGPVQQGSTAPREPGVLRAAALYTPSAAAFISPFQAMQG